MKRFIAAVLVLFLTIVGNATIVSAAASASSGAILLLDSEIMQEAGLQRKYPFHIAHSGEYELVIEYKCISDKNITPQVTATIDNGETEIYDLPRVWTMSTESLGDDGRFKQDNQGNELTPTYEETAEWQTIRLQSYVLIEGTHTLSLSMIRENIFYRSIRMQPVKAVDSYSDYLKQFADTPKSINTVKKEAELISAKSHLEIALSYDRANPAVSPNDPTGIRYNLLGGWTFGTERQWIEWTVDIPQTGMYALEFTYRQNENNGLNSRRQITIDGSLPFAECGSVEFPYCSGFKTMTIGNDAPYAFFLETGTHTIRMEVVLTGLKDVLKELSDVITQLNMLYSRIMVIVGETADSHRDYDLDEHVDGLCETLNVCKTKLWTIADTLDNGERSGSQTARVREAGRLLESMAEAPQKIPVRMENFRSQINTLADLLGGIKNQPLELDYFCFKPMDSETVQPKSTFLDTLVFKLKAFMNSFCGDYNNISASSSTDKLKVWVSANDISVAGFATGREHAQIITRLASEKFSTATDVSVELSLISAQDTLLPALVSGKGPDVALFLPKTVISNLYYRDALLELSENMPDYSQIENRFYPSSMVGLKVGGKIYALPEVQSYNMMFIRNDIFDLYELSAPDTWEMFYSTLSKLQKKGMQAGILESPQIYETFLLQYGGSMYDSGLKKTNMNSTESIKAFTDWTNLYVKYGMPMTFDMLSRFRTGQMPIVIAPSYFYCQLVVGAPEISGRWSMLPIPGMQSSSEDKYNRSEVCNISGAAIMKQTASKDAALSFLDWWTSDEVQQNFAFECEVRLGISGRYFPANLSVLDSLAWTNAERSALRTQWQAVNDIPQSTATYYVQRNLTNAFRRTVYYYENPRDVIYRLCKTVDDELERKNRELYLNEDDIS